MTRGLAVVLLLAIMACGADGGKIMPVSAQQTPSVEAPVWQLGDHWQWLLGTNQQVTDTVVDTLNGYVVSEAFGSDTSMEHFNTDFSSPDVHFGQFQFPLTVGTKWSYTINGTFNGRPSKWDIDRTVQAMEPVTVPAGTFDAVRIAGHHCNITLGGCGNFTVWYAPQVRNVAKITWSTGYWISSIRGTTQVLVSYQLSNP